MAGEGLSLVYKNILLNNDFQNSRALQNKTGSNWVFGKPGERDLEGAREVMTDWRYHTPSRLQSRQKDFRTINKISVKRGLSTSKDFRMAGKTETLYTNHNEGSASTSFVLPEDDLIFGQPNRPSTPLNEVLGNLYNAHSYGVQSAVTNQEIYKARLQEVQRRGSYLPKVNNKPVQPIHLNPIKRQDIDDLTRDHRVFKLKRFENVKPKVATVNKEYVATRPSVKTAHMRSSSCGASRSMRNI